MTTIVGRNRAGQAGKPDDLLSGASLCYVMASVVSPGVRAVCNVARPIPPSGACYDLFDVSVMALRREAALSEAACDALLLATQSAPSVLLGALCSEAVTTCQVLGPISVVCDDGCRLPRSDKVLGVMREAFAREQSLLGLAQWHVGQAHVGVRVL